MSVIHAEARFRAKAAAALHKLDFQARFAGFIPWREGETVVEFRATKDGIQRLEYPIEHLRPMEDWRTLTPDEDDNP